jgi:hypothetical protein
MTSEDEPSDAVRIAHLGYGDRYQQKIFEAGVLMTAIGNLRRADDYCAGQDSADEFATLHRDASRLLALRGHALLRLQALDTQKPQTSLKY